MTTNLCVGISGISGISYKGRLDLQHPTRRMRVISAVTVATRKNKKKKEALDECSNKDSHTVVQSQPTWLKGGMSEDMVYYY